ncbi:MAG: hypothetical protein RL748_381 [Pseudomonadota bacterium]|jgi:beta-lactamase regulating signal transducer with metallopeptidase domain/predicted  nucleic acid-binding Zn-ribbon protein
MSALFNLPALPAFINTFLYAPFTQNLGWALLHFVWQGALIGCITAVLLALLRNNRPQTRYAIACGSLLLCLALPLWQIARFAAPETPAMQPAAQAMADSAAVLNEAGRAMLANGNPAGFDWASLAPWMVALWVTGISLFALRMVLGALWLRRLYQQADGAGQGELQQALAHWQQKLDILATRFGLQRSVRLRLGHELDSPVTAGWLRPVIFVPAALLTGMPPDFLEALLAHELAHVKRFDYVINLLQSAIEMLLFYHPAVWWISKQIRIEREQIADDLAASRLGEPRRLALALQQLDLFQSSINQFAPAANGGVLMSRIKRLIRPEARSLNWKVTMPLAGLVLVCSALYSNVQAVGTHAGSSDKPVAPALPPVPAVSEVPAPAPAPVPAPAVSEVPPPPPAPPAPAGTINKRSHKAAPAVPPVPPLPPLPPVARAHADRFSYAIVSPKSGTTITSGTDQAQQAQLRKLKMEAKQDFLWFQKDGKGFVVTDPQLVASALAARGPAGQLEQKMEALNQKMAQESKKLEALGESMSHIQDDPATKALEAAANQLGEQMGALGAKQGEIGAEMGKLGAAMATATSEQERAQLQQEMAQLKQKMEPLRKEMKAKQAELQAEVKRLTANLEPLKKLGKEMREKSQPLHDLGKQMGQLGNERQRMEADIARAINEVIEKSLISGSAKSL